MRILPIDRMIERYRVSIEEVNDSDFDEKLVESRLETMLEAWVKEKSKTHGSKSWGYRILNAEIVDLPSTDIYSPNIKFILHVAYTFG